MATVTIMNVVDAIEATLGAATGIVRSESMDELSEGTPDLPLLQVYWSGLTVSLDSETDVFGFGDASNQPIRHYQHRIFVDILASARSHLDQDYEAIATTAEAVITVLDSENAPPYFGQAGIKAFSYTAEAIGWEDTEPIIVGERFIIMVHLF